MVWAIHELHDDRMEWNEHTWERLTGTRHLMNMLRGGSHPTEIYAAWEDELAGFRQISSQYLIY